MMRALRFYAKGDVRLETIPVPSPGPGQVRLKPAYVGICGTDVHEYSRGATLIPNKPHSLTSRSVPLTIGHEISGVIDAIGEGVSGLYVNDHVAVQPVLSDATCYACRRGRPNCCVQQGFYGLSADGGLADYLVIEAQNARKVPQVLPLELAALVEPLAVGWHAVRRNLSTDYESALVIGTGPIGLAIIQALKAQGVAMIIAADLNPVRREYAMRAGAHHFVDSMNENVADSCARLVPSIGGVQVAFDTAGKQTTLEQSVAAVCVGGTIVNVAIWGGPASVMPNTFALAEKAYTGTSVYTKRDFDEVISSIESGTMDPGFMVTTKIALEDVVEKGLVKLLHDPGLDIKILVDVMSASGLDKDHLSKADQGKTVL